MLELGKAVLTGALAGAVGGLLGIGGAIIMVPLMVYYLNFSQHSAHATSLAVIIPGAVMGALVYNSFGQLDLGLAALFAVGGMIGAYIGSSLLPKVKPKMLKRLFAVLALFLSIRMGLGL
ncbi:MAG: sulfite exporter TauE/SafE family protein [Negativicutes bacterium]|nr:sulfite exporter TauE/SafE family protein [Negativicutes bacterium]